MLLFLSVCACLSSFVSCDEAFCAEPPEILNAQPDLQDITPPFHNGTNITYKCIDGFALLPGANLYVVCVVDNETASWIQDENVLCTQVCSELPNIPNAVLVIEGKDPPFHPGTKIPIKCAPGFISSGGISHHAECILDQGSATWNHPPEPCRPRSCGFPGDIENAQRIGNVFSYPSNVTYKCNNGYKMKGRSVLFCLPSGKWAPSLPSCEPIVCPLLPDPQDGRVVFIDRNFDAVATYQCDKGFHLEGPKQRTCRSDSQWSENSPLCKRVSCLPPGEFENGRVVNAKDIYNYEDFVIFKCLYGPTTRTSKCLEDGRWSHNPPTCPTAPSGGSSVAPSTKPPTSSPGNGNAETPTPDSVAPTTKPPTSSGNVNASMCEDPGNIPHGKRITSGFSPGSNVTYTCEDGYDLRGKGTLICLGTGKWNLDKLPICVKPIPVAVIVGVVIGIILIAVAGGVVYFCYRWKENNPKGYAKKCKASAADAADLEEIDRLDKDKKPIPVTVL